jgi:hypothetical protein
MKAPFSEKARRIFSDDEAAQKVITAARKGESVRVEVDGNTYLVCRASRSASDRADASEESGGCLGTFPL